MPRRTAVALAIVLDVAVVVIFVAIGRREHEEGAAASDFVTTAAPFLFGLLAGWIASRAWRSPLHFGAGVAIWAATIIVGMFTRKVVFDDGIAFAFIVVATLFLGVGLTGWRALANKRDGWGQTPSVTLDV
ncbi:MAG TPA: DUF3054 domain-containing protein [Ilumatobacter sp.]|nr:DUF3054 domain-containing protein [Ilumatobacter sp.]